MPRVRLLFMVGVVLGSIAAGGPPAGAAPVTTATATVQDCDGDDLLERAPGEQHVDLGSQPPADEPAACAKDDRSPLRLSSSASLLNFLQLSDFQTVDEESPARVEFLDGTQRAPGLNPFSAAYRPQESLTTQVTEAMVRQARNTTSPVTGAKLDLTILTGDNADSQQYNETRWFIDVLDGTTGGDDPDPEMHPGTDRKIVPDSGFPDQVASCGAAAVAGYRDNGSVYDGVRGGGRPGPDQGYYEPDGSSGVKDDGDGYSPDRARNASEVPGADVVVRDFPGLLEAAQQPFEAVGLGMPWYSAFGNHDALVQGNSPEAYAGPLGTAPETVNPAFDGLARGCVKPSNSPVGVSPEDFIADPGAFLGAMSSTIVPPDPRRCYVAKDEPNGAATPCSTGGWIQQHSRTTGLPVGHGFAPFSAGAQSGEGRPPEAVANHDGYYTFHPKPGFRFVVLDTITDECGTPVCSEGSVDDPQYKWAEAQLDAADAAGERVLVFSHHTLRTTRFPSTDPTEQPIHYGERQDRLGGQPVRPDSAPESTLEDLWCRHESVLAHVVGHEHANYVLRHGCEDSTGKNAFYEVSTAAHIDWPQQSRMIELVNRGGELTLVLTMLDHAGEPRTDSADAGPLQLASIAREISYDDYQSARSARGARTDRNVVVGLGRPASASGMLALARTAPVGTAGRFAFPFAATPGTRATLDFVAGATGRKAAAARAVRVARARVVVGASGKARAVTRLTRAGRRMLRTARRGRLAVAVRATLKRGKSTGTRRTARLVLTRR